MQKLIPVAIALAAMLSAGCATKQYPQAAAVSEAEAAAFTCDDIRLEIIRVQSIQQEIESTGEFDGKTVIGFIGDFGIGNGVAKSGAREKAQTRLDQLKNLQASKECETEE